MSSKKEELEAEVLPLTIKLRETRLAREAVLEKAGEHAEKLAYLDIDFASGVIERDDYVSERKRWDHEYKRIEAELMAITRRRNRAYKKFWQGEYNFIDEYTRNYEIETLNKSLIIYCNPSLNVLSLRDDSEFKLTGYEVWDSGLTLAKYLEVTSANNSWIRGKNVLEIASGTGLVGIVAACLGANVTATDLPVMVPFMQKNIDANGAHLAGTGGNIRTQNLFWGNEEEMKLIPKPDIILVSGAVYDDESVEILVSTLATLSDESTELILCNEDWSEVSIDKTLVWDRFMENARKHFELSVVSLDGIVAPIYTGHGTGKVLLLRGFLKNADKK